MVTPMKWFCSVVLATGLIAAACSGDDNKEEVPADTVVEDSARLPDATEEVAVEEVRVEITPDVVDEPFPLPPLDTPVPLKVGVAASLLPAPLGIPVCGFAPPNKPTTPYSDTFPGSSFIYQHPTLRVIAVEGGTARLLLVRFDLIGVNTPLIERVEHDLTEITGYDWKGKVIAGATHSHSSAGRLAFGLIWGIMADSFFPEFFERVVGKVVDLSVEAILDMEPGRMGYGFVETDRLHNDRRCENPELRDDRVHLLRFDRADETPKALLMVHSVHGTVIGAENMNFSRDAVGGIEEKVKESFDDHVEVLFFQAGTGDMSPSSPTVDMTGDLPAIPGDYNRIEKIGELAAEDVQSVFWGIETSTDVAVSSASHYVPLGRELMGYEEGVFPFEGGGAYCGSTIDSKCWTGEPVPLENMDKACIDIAMMAEGLGYDESAPDRTMLSAALLGDVLLMTFPGEPVTQLLLDIEEGVRTLFPGQEKIVVIGYSQDYIGYSTPEWDFYQGGYEASGALWGPRQGDYLAGHAISIGANTLDTEYLTAFDDPGPYPLLQPESAPYSTAYSIDGGTIVSQPAASVAAGETVIFEFAGGDPWFLMPEVVLEKEVDGVFAPVLRSNGTPVDGAGYEFFVEVLPEPDYELAKTVQARKFVWRFQLPTDRRVEAAPFPLSGTYRFHARGEMRVSGVESYELISATFQVN